MKQSELQPKSNKCVIIGEKYSIFLNEALMDHGFFPLFLPDNPDLDERLSGHVDLSVFYDGENDFFLSAYLFQSELSDFLQKHHKNVHFLNYRQGKCYPEDVPLNIRLCGNRFIYNSRTADKSLVDYLVNVKKIIPVDCRQGYAACCTMVLKGESIITSDDGIYQSAKSEFSDVMKISQGSISLEGFDYGFIGGSTFLAKDVNLQETVYFTGNLDHHPDQKAILNKIQETDMNAVFLTDLPIFDIGGAVVFEV